MSQKEKPILVCIKVKDLPEEDLELESVKKQCAECNLAVWVPKCSPDGIPVCIECIEKKCPEVKMKLTPEQEVFFSKINPERTSYLLGEMKQMGIKEFLRRHYPK